MDQKPKALTPQLLQEVLMDSGKNMSAISERSRLLEERLKQTREKLQVIDETLLNKISELKKEIKDVAEEVGSFRKEFDELKEIIRRVAKEMGQTAKLSDVRVLEKYIELFDITRIVTKEDVYKIVEEEISKSKKK
jgi:hypothetical protein